jgi:hypothetical protein
MSVKQRYSRWLERKARGDEALKPLVNGLGSKSPFSRWSSHARLLRRFTWRSLFEPSQQVKEVLQAEQDWLQKRREKAGRPKGDPATDAVGLSFSGGGIRSATFNLGLLQALERYGLLKSVDYLSTVSGGGYIGAAFTWFKAKQPSTFPFGTTRRDHGGIGGRVLAWLRAHGDYLTPGHGITVWSLVAAILTGTLVNLVILVPIMLLVFYLLSREFFATPVVVQPYIQWLPLSSSQNDGFIILMLLSVISAAIFLLWVLVFVLAASLPRFQAFTRQRRLREHGGRALMFAVLFGIVGTLPIVYNFLAGPFYDWMRTVMSGISAAGLVSMLSALRGRKEGNETRGWRSTLLSVGLALLIYGVFLWFYHLAGGVYTVVGQFQLFTAAFASVILASIANINHVSMHRYYRNRLMEAYMPPSVEGAASGDKKPDDAKSHWYPYASQREADRCYLRNIPITDAPYHLINTNVQLIGSANPKWRGRGGDNFVLSPLYVGADSTGHASTMDFAGGAMNLATAFAVSGAAVDPNTYATRSRPLAFVMTLLNIRLGYWIQNPRWPVILSGLLSRPWWYVYMLREMLGKGLNETNSHVHLSDGGHFENLGLYELIRRRCRFIVASDAGADPDWTFADLARLMELVRVDFGAQIDLSTNPLHPRGKDRRSRRPFVRGRIWYHDGTQGDLLYIKTSIIDDLSEDIYGYRRANPSFPDQTTADQFFDEAQFEAYRELGFEIGRRVCCGDDCNSAETLFERLDTALKSTAIK